MNATAPDHNEPCSGNCRTGFKAAVIALLAAIHLLLFGVTAHASSAIVIGKPLPPVTITEGGRVVLNGDDYSVAPWSWPGSLEKVQVIQYVPGTRQGGGLYDPLTERMQKELDIERYEITAIVNLDVTSGFIKPFVRSAVVDEQRMFTRATLILDEQGVGQSAWDLPQQATFVVMDRGGVVVDVILGPPSEADLERSFRVLRDLILSE